MTARAKQLKEIKNLGERRLQRQIQIEGSNPDRLRAAWPGCMMKASLNPGGVPYTVATMALAHNTLLERQGRQNKSAPGNQTRAFYCQALETTPELYLELLSDPIRYPTISKKNANKPTMLEMQTVYKSLPPTPLPKTPTALPRTTTLSVPLEQATTSVPSTRSAATPATQSQLEILDLISQAKDNTYNNQKKSVAQKLASCTAHVAKMVKAFQQVYEYSEKKSAELVQAHNQSAQELNAQLDVSHDLLQQYDDRYYEHVKLLENIRLRLLDMVEAFSDENVKIIAKQIADMASLRKGVNI